MSNSFSNNSVSKQLYLLPTKLATGRAIVTVLLGSLPLIFFYEAVLGKVALVQGDGWTANLGLRILTSNLLAQGVLPLWNPYIFGGMPLLASVYPGVLYPPNWLFIFLPPGIAMNLVVITTFHIALVGTYRYARCIGCYRPAALLTAIGFAFGGYMVMSLGQTSNIAAAAWLPWIVLSVEKLFRAPARHWIVLGAICIALQLFAGVPQMSWYTIIVCSAYFIFTLFTRSEQGARTRFTFNVGLMCFLGSLLSLIQLLPLRELQQVSGRVALTYEQFAEFSFPIKQVWSLLIPFIFGGATMQPYRVPYWGETGIFVTCAYVGLLSWMLATVAMLGRKHDKLVWFWSGMAGLALILALGDHLPFQLNRLLFSLPVYNLFRASFRHAYEFTFAMAILAGLGLNWLLQTQQQATRLSALRKSLLLVGCAFVSAVIVCLGLGALLAPGGKLPEQVRLITNPELLIPLSFFLLSGITLWRCAVRPSLFAQTLLLVVFFFDLAAYGHALEWRAYPYQMFASLADPPSVQFIKEHERDWNSFRFLSLTSTPFGQNYTALNYPNASLARGLQSVNGYDMLRMMEPASFMGAMTPEGVVTEQDSLGISHQGFNLLNVKYLLCERSLPLMSSTDLIYQGARFSEAPLDVHLSQGDSREFRPAGVWADELSLVTTLSNSSHLADDMVIAQIKVLTEGGRNFDFDIKAGRDTAEWAYDRADVKATIRHKRSTVVESWQEDGFEGHRYLTQFNFERSKIERIEIRQIREGAELVVFRASLHDKAQNIFYPPDSLKLPTDRWKKIGSFAEVDIYENLVTLPRVWIVYKTVPLTRDETLKSVKEGRLPDGKPFHPEETALVEREHSRVLDLPISTSPGQAPEVKMLRYSASGFELTASSQQTGLLVLSEIYYPGWLAWVDGKPAEVYRVNGILRGIFLSPGQHLVNFRFRPQSLQVGVAGFMLGAILIALLLLLPRRLYHRLDLEKKENS